MTHPHRHVRSARSCGKRVIVDCVAMTTIHSAHYDVTHSQHGRRSVATVNLHSKSTFLCLCYFAKNCKYDIPKKRLRLIRIRMSATSRNCENTVFSQAVDTLHQSRSQLRHAALQKCTRRHVPVFGTSSASKTIQTFREPPQH